MHESNNTGQGILEAVLGLPLIMTLLYCVGSLSYRAIIYHAAIYHLHESLICLDGANESICKTELQHRIQKLFILGKVPMKIILNKNSYTSHGTILVHFNPILKVEQTYEGLK